MYIGPYATYHPQPFYDPNPQSPFRTMSPSYAEPATPPINWSQLSPQRMMEMPSPRTFPPPAAIHWSPVASYSPPPQVLKKPPPSPSHPLLRPTPSSPHATPPSSDSQRPATSSGPPTAVASPNTSPPVIPAITTEQLAAAFSDTVLRRSLAVLTALRDPAVRNRLRELLDADPPACQAEDCGQACELGTTLCPVHACPYCPKAKPAAHPHCGGDHLCVHVSEGTGRCTKRVREMTSEDDTQQVYDLCGHHSCPLCGGEKDGDRPHCPNCAPYSTGTKRRPSALDLPDWAGKEWDRRPRWLFVFDFDQTITVRHTSGQQPVATLTDDYVTGNLVDPDLLRSVFEEIQSHQDFFKIATFADELVARPELLQGRALVSRYLDVVFGADRSFLRPDGMEAFHPAHHRLPAVGKNVHIRNLLRQINRRKILVPDSHVVLFDDSAENIEKAQQAGYRGYHCREGFTPLVWQHFLTDTSWGPTPRAPSSLPSSPVARHDS